MIFGNTSSYMVLCLYSRTCFLQLWMEVCFRAADGSQIRRQYHTQVWLQIMWYRNCSHENQPSLVLRTRYDPENYLNPLPHFHLVKSHSSESYDLLIMNITVSGEGLYYCGTEQIAVEDNKNIAIHYKFVYKYGNVITRILFGKYSGRFLYLTFIFYGLNRQTLIILNIYNNKPEFISEFHLISVSYNINVNPVFSTLGFNV